MDERSRRNGYAQFSTDRADKARGEMRGNEPGARFVLVNGDRAILEITGQSRFRPLFSADELPTFGCSAEGCIFLGNDSAGPIYAVGADLPEEERHPAIKAIDLRSIATQGLLAQEDLSLVGGAKALLAWHSRHGFCANCGAQTKIAHGGWRRECPSCNAVHFPRVDPVVIMLATDGDNALLARSPHFGPGMYSALAGFVEPAETIEDAVRRELGEEAGIETGAVRYHSSQPWPFPSSLMIGCMAEASSTDITIDADEIEHARWFTREELAEMLEFRHADGLFVPPPTAIAHQLIRSFVDGEAV